MHVAASERLTRTVTSAHDPESEVHKNTLWCALMRMDAFSWQTIRFYNALRTLWNIVHIVQDSELWDGKSRDMIFWDVHEHILLQRTSRNFENTPSCILWTCTRMYQAHEKNQANIGALLSTASSPRATSIMCYHVLSCAIMCYHVLSCAIMCYHVLSCLLLQVNDSREQSHQPMIPSPRFTKTHCGAP